MKRRDFVGYVGLGAAALLLGRACLPEDTTDVRRRLLRSWTEELAIGEYQALVSAAQSLTERAGELAEDPTDERLQAAKQAWRNARGPLKRAELFGFGPYLEEPQRYGPKLDFWPVRPEAVELVLSGSDALDAAGTLALGAPSKGFPAMEYLLWAPGAVVADFGGRRGEYLKALAGELVRVAERLLEAWKTGFALEVSEAGLDHVELFPTLPAALGGVIQQAAVLIEMIRGDKLGKPLGDAAGGVPQPDKCESQYSGDAMQDILHNLDGVRGLLFGRAADDTQAEVLGLNAYLTRLKPELATRVRTKFDAAVASCLEVRLPLTEAVERSPALVRSAADALGELQRLIEVDVLGALAVSVGFSGNDGD
ncbi:MAG: imelysin family protein [Polyangiaceae bacterium]